MSRGACLRLWILSFHSRGFGQSNSLPTASSVGGGMGRRNPRQYQIASRNVPSARLGLLGTSGFVSSNQRHTAANPTVMKQGRQVGSVLGIREVDQTQGLGFRVTPTQIISKMETDAHPRGDLNRGGWLSPCLPGNRHLFVWLPRELSNPWRQCLGSLMPR